jgi:hypothetical protein
MVDLLRGRLQSESAPVELLDCKGQTLGTRSTAARGPQPMSTTRICQSELTALGKLALTSTFADELMNCRETSDE